MIRTTLNWTIKNLKSMYDGKHTLYMSHPIQRQSGQWDGDKLKKSLLIHSIFANYPVPPLYCLKEPINDKDYSYSVLDGKQRLTTIFDYLDGKYPLDEETPNVVIDDVTYELGNKYFTDLDVECQQELLRFKFVIYGFEDADDDLIEEIFFRLNNSTPLSKPQKSMALTGVKNASFIKTILNGKFFTEICKFSALQRRKSDDMCTLLQAMMLLDNRHNEYEYSSLSADEVMRYATYIKNNYSEEQKKRLCDILAYLEKAFLVQDKYLKKINIPMVMLAADLAMGKDYNPTKGIYRVGPMYFRNWFSYFCIEEYDEYRNYCSSGSTKKEKTLKRIETMEHSLKHYFELEEVSELGPQKDTPSAEDVLENTTSSNTENEECVNTSISETDISTDVTDLEEKTLENVDYEKITEKPPIEDSTTEDIPTDSPMEETLQEEEITE